MNNLNNFFIDVIVRNKKCPICEKEMLFSNEKTFLNDKNLYVLDSKDTVYCKNKCFYFEEDYGGGFVSIFGEEIHFIDNSSKKILQIAKKLIRKWKENDKYLVEILENNDGKF